MGFNKCPLPLELTTVPASDCPVDFGQVVRALLMRPQVAAIFAPAVTTPFLPIVTSAALTTILAGIANAKGILTPLFSGLVFPETEIIIEGENDNSTLFGAGDVVGGNVVRVKPMFTSLSSDQALALAKLNGEPRLEIVYFNEYNQAILKKNGHGFEIYNPAMSDVMSEGKNKKNKTPFGYTKRFGWSEGYTVVDLPFNVLNTVQA